MYHKTSLTSIIRSIAAFPRIPSYTYKPLTGPSSSIRLILLQPAPFLTSPISCRVIETSWEEERGTKTGYTALSYTWGSPTPQSRIEIDGRPFYITKNLELALRYLRLPRQELRLWADSICINQEDVEERNQHVRQMRDIYSAANETTIFLGEATESSDILLNAIKESRYQISIATTKMAVVKSVVKASGLRRKELVELAFQLLWRPYWMRMWIFQEIVVSHNLWVQCGSLKVPWEDLCQVLIAILDSESSIWGSGYGNEPQRRLEDIYWERRAYRHAQGFSQTTPGWHMASGNEFEGRMKLLDLLVTKRGSEASDSRDMVFAVSGIATRQKDWDPISITYEKSASLVYMSVVKYLLDHDGSYEILSQASPHHQDPKEQHKIPTWAPDWRYKSHPSRKIIDWIPTSSSSKGLVRANNVCLAHHRVLACIGYKYDTIFSFGDAVEEIKPSPDSIGRVIWDNKWYRRKLIEHGVLLNSGTKLGTVAQLFARSHPLTYQRKLAKTKSGILCLVPRETEVGDAICQFIGSPVPFILRPLKVEDWKPEELSVWGKIIEKIRKWLTWSNAPDSYSDIVDEDIRVALNSKKEDNRDIDVQHHIFVGECYVDGLMSQSYSNSSEKGSNSVAFALH